MNAFTGTAQRAAHGALTAILALSCAAAAAQAVAPAGATAYPNKPVRIVVPYPAGGILDSLARSVSNKMGEKWGVSMVVENRAGSNGNLGTDVAAKSKPDGYTILITSEALVVGPSLYPKLPYDPVKDFTPVTRLATMAPVLIVNAASPYHSLQDFIAAAKVEKGNMAFGSTGTGGSAHLNTEMLKKLAGIEAVHVPYAGMSPAMADLVGGRLQFMLSTLGSALPYIQGGKVRVLALASDKRAPTLPDVPTFAEAGLPGYEASGWFCMLAPAGTPEAIVAKLNATVVSILAEPELRRKFAAGGLDVNGSTPAELGRFIQTETVKWSAVVKESGARLD